MVKNLPAMRETWIQSLNCNIPWRREGLPTPVFWLELLTALATQSLPSWMSPEPVFPGLAALGDAVPGPGCRRRQMQAPAGGTPKTGPRRPKARWRGGPSGSPCCLCSRPFTGTAPQPRPGLCPLAPRAEALSRRASVSCCSSLEDGAGV